MLRVRQASGLFSTSLTVTARVLGSRVDVAIDVVVAGVPATESLLGASLRDVLPALRADASRRDDLDQAA